MKAYKHLIKHALKSGHTVSVWDGEEWQVKKSAKYTQIVDAVESVEEATLRIRDAEGTIVAWALVSAYGLEDDETVMDYGVNEFMDAWDKSYSVNA